MSSKDPDSSSLVSILNLFLLLLLRHLQISMPYFGPKSERGAGKWRCLRSGAEQRKNHPSLPRRRRRRHRS